MPKLINLTGRAFGRLTVLHYHGKGKRRKSLWLCKCECGEERIVSSGNLMSGNSTSCGCYRLEVIKETSSVHGMSQTIEFTTWVNITQRCTNPNSPDYPNYGGRGICVSPRWVGEHGFQNFYADMGPRPSSKHSVDRIDNENGNYGPDNCRWATKREQDRNKRNNHWIEYNGMRMILEDWARSFGLKRASCLSLYLKTHSMDDAYAHYAKPRDYKHKKSNVWIEHEGNIMIASDWEKFIGISHSCFWEKRKTMTISEIIRKYKK